MDRKIGQDDAGAEFKRFAIFNHLVELAGVIQFTSAAIDMNIFAGAALHHVTAQFADYTN
ncbi:MAG: hypothetical protein ACU0C9_10260 [Paracoccaceae bacterium]